jgi:hypothetical protein
MIPGAVLFKQPMVVQMDAFAVMMALVTSIVLPAQNPTSVPKLALRCASPCSFRQGESIWLDLDFTASAPNAYRISINYNDRDVALEEFIVTPQEGASDPLAPYDRLVRVQGGSFRFDQQPLSETPVTIRLNLNQWIRFDQPGTYHVSVISPRLASRLKSNEIALKIIPAELQWQREQLARIHGVLDAIPAPRFGESEARQSAIRELCDLGTEDAAREIARRLDSDDRSIRLYESGLIRSPYRDAGVREMERLLVDADSPVAEFLLAALANVSVDANSDPAEMVRRAAANRAALRQKLIDVLPVKRGPALAPSANTLLKLNDLSQQDRRRVEAILAKKSGDLIRAK